MTRLAAVLERKDDTNLLPKGWPIKHCPFCGEQLFRRLNMAQGKSEQLWQFNRRNYCDQSCSNKHNGQKTMYGEVKEVPVERDLSAGDEPPRHLPVRYCEAPGCGKPIPWLWRTPSQYAKAKGCCMECGKTVGLIKQKAHYEKHRSIYGETKTPEKTKAEIPFEGQRVPAFKPGKVISVSEEAYEAYWANSPKLYFEDHRGR